MGYIEETGIAQQYRDVRITTIYEGTTGIQALDLVGRKLIRDMGATATTVIKQMESSPKTLRCARQRRRQRDRRSAAQAGIAALGGRLAVDRHERDGRSARRRSRARCRT